MENSTPSLITLFNSVKATNFIYEIKNLSSTDEDLEQINSCETFSDKIKLINEMGGSLVYAKMENNTFKNNLILIDSNLDQIVAEVLRIRYSSSENRLRQLVMELNQKNPLSYDISENHKFYSYKMKKFLADIAIGMMPLKLWDGKYDSTGKYLIVKEGGTHIDFEDYLLNNNKFETPSTSRYDFGYVYKDGGHHFIKLNLQIRFLK